MIGRQLGFLAAQRPPSATTAAPSPGYRYPGGFYESGGAFDARVLSEALAKARAGEGTGLARFFPGTHVRAAQQQRREDLLTHAPVLTPARQSAMYAAAGAAAARTRGAARGSR